MKKVARNNYSDYINYANSVTYGKVYPVSISEGIQAGDIYIDCEKNCQSILFWHHCGFAFLLGKCDTSFLEDVYELMQNKDNTNPRRFILFSNDKHIADFFGAKNNTVIERRYFFEYLQKRTDFDHILPAGFELKEIDARLLSTINGRITPSFSWDNPNDFFDYGKGYCIVHEGKAAAWAFSSASSSKEIDIGIETNINYRHRGFAAIVADAMLQYTLSEGKTPVWACHYENISSQKLAEKIEFVKTSECLTIKIKED
ncbi:MAG: GNAT family N-acetyltransferase [Clostridia bacterium]|nr:GNAT family N-acetyltransferase [Clostridia bacterium]